MSETRYPKMVYNPSDAAFLCGGSAEDMTRFFQNGAIKAFQVSGRHWRVTHENLGNYMESQGIEKPSFWQEPPQKFRVLLVEDDPDLLEITSELLKDEPNVEVRCENNGFTAGLQIAGWYPDLVLLDFLMPGISGFELCSQLRLREATADLPVLALTSLTGVEKKREIFESGVSDFLGKPFHSEELLQKVQVMLGLIPAGTASLPKTPEE